MSSENETKLPFYRRITGFQSGRKLTAVIAVAWYVFVTYFCLTIQNVDKSGKPITGFLSWSTNIALWLVFILETLYLGNSFGWRDRLPYKKKEERGRAADYLRIALGFLIIFFGMGVLSGVAADIYQSVTR